MSLNEGLKHLGRQMEEASIDLVSYDGDGKPMLCAAALAELFSIRACQARIVSILKRG